MKKRSLELPTDETAEDRRTAAMKTIFGRHHTTAETLLQHPKAKKLFGMVVISAVILLLPKK